MTDSESLSSASWPVSRPSLRGTCSPGLGRRGRGNLIASVEIASSALLAVGSQMSARVDYLKPQQLYLFDTRVVTQNGVPTSVEDKGERLISVPYVEPLKEELRQFISSVNSRQKPLADGLVGMRAVLMAEAALTSAGTGKVAKLPPR